MWKHHKCDTHRSRNRRSSSLLSSHTSSSSYRHTRQCHLVSITPILDMRQSQSTSTNCPTDKRLPPIIDLYAPPTTNVIRFEHVKEINTGQDIFIQ